MHGGAAGRAAQQSRAHGELDAVLFSVGRDLLLHEVERLRIDQRRVVGFLTGSDHDIVLTTNHVPGAIDILTVFGLVEAVDTQIDIVAQEVAQDRNAPSFSSSFCPEKECQECLEQTENHVRIVRGMFKKNLDPEKEAPGRIVET